MTLHNSEGITLQHWIKNCNNDHGGNDTNFYNIYNCSDSNNDFYSGEQYGFLPLLTSASYESVTRRYSWYRAGYVTVVHR